MSRRVVGWVAVALLGTMTAAGCGESAPVASTTTTQPATGSSAGQPAAVQSGAAPAAGAAVITEAEATALLTEINKTNNAANAAYDGQLLGTVEAEAAVESDRAVYKMLRSTDPQIQDPPKAFEYEPTGFRVPAAGAGAQWFVIDAAYNAAGGTSPLVVAREATGGPWKVVHVVTVQGGLPDTAKDAAGNAVAVAPDDATGLVASPAKIAEEHAAYLSGRPSTLFDGDAESDEMLDQTRKGMQFTKGGARPAPAASFTADVTVAPYPVRALRTADGGAVVAYTTRSEYVAQTPGATAVLTPSLRAVAEGRVPTGKLTVEARNMWWVSVPAAGGGKVKALGSTNEAITAS